MYYSNILLFVFIVLFNDVVKFDTEETKRSYVECCSRKEGSEIARLLGGYGG
jgi:trehalose-6-phosphate synthase